VNQGRVWRIMVDVTRLVCGEATDGFGWSCVSPDMISRHIDYVIKLLETATLVPPLGRVRPHDRLLHSAN
jgi:hypothetical protein